MFAYACSNDSETCEDGIISWTPTRSTLTNPEDWENWDALPYSYATTDDCAVSTEGCNDGHSYANNYYNWAAAVASNNMDYSKEPDGSTLDADNSICPAGWRLPSDRNKDFGKLFYAYGITTNDSDAGYADANGYSKTISSPLYFTEAGQIQHTSRDFLGQYGYYWTSTSKSWSKGIHMRFFDGTLVPGLGDTNKRFGFSVRCLAR